MVSPTITVDIGTTSIKMCLFDRDARLLASGKQETPTLDDGSGEIYDLPAYQAYLAQDRPAT